MKSFQRGIALFSIVTALGFFAGCGGPGAPVPGGSDASTEAANAALAPEGGPPPAAAKGDAGGATEKTSSEPAAESPEAASAPAPESES